jgi:hypothetical protein
MLGRNDAPVSATAADLAMGRGVRSETSRHSAVIGDEQLWQQAYDDAVKQGAGPDVARVFANKTLAYERAERDGVERSGARNFQAYR